MFQTLRFLLLFTKLLLPCLLPERIFGCSVSHFADPFTQVGSPPSEHSDSGLGFP